MGLSKGSSFKADKDGYKNGSGSEFAGCPGSTPLRIVRHAVVATVVVSLIYVFAVQGVATVCKLPNPTASCPVPTQTQKTWKFWRREAEPTADEVSEAEEDASSSCVVAWDVLEYLPSLPWIQYPESDMTTECPNLTESAKSTRKNPFQKLFSMLKFSKKKKASNDSTAHYQQAFTTGWKLTPVQIQSMKHLSARVRSQLSDVQLEAVAWGGPGGPPWWSPPHSNGRLPGVDGLDGGRTLASYLRIMKWPEDSITYFPFKLCKDGCGAERTISHTVEWRTKYKPWLMTPSAMKENKNGFVYFRGHSPSLSGDTSGHSMVWYRVGEHKVDNPEAYFRAVLNTLDASIADNLKRSHQKVGKYNVILDGDNFRFSMMPNLNDVKRGLVMMQDHFPDRLGMVFLANMSKAGEILFNLISPFISKEVRDKIRLLPHDPKKRQAILETVVENKYIPDWLGGTDTYRFDPSSYYSTRHQWTEKEGREYLQTMPYHS